MARTASSTKRGFFMVRGWLPGWPLGPITRPLRNFASSLLAWPFAARYNGQPPCRNIEPRALAQKLIEQGWLTPYQVNQLRQGKGQQLSLGSYVLLERLGEGGMGELFKARHQKMGRIVAIKLIHKERLANEAAEGSMMGTLDYVVPEQARDSHAVDIRADLYSLGCTFYFLLTGQVPFPGGEALEKLYKHGFEEAKPVEVGIRLPGRQANHLSLGRFLLLEAGEFQR
jgi:hypothetical protein